MGGLTWPPNSHAGYFCKLLWQTTLANYSANHIGALALKNSHKSFQSRKWS